jgi:OOP family OmpA-OmpF porin
VISRFPAGGLAVALCSWLWASPAGAEINWPKLTLSSYVGTADFDASYGMTRAIPIGGRAGFTVSNYLGLEGSYGKVFGDRERVPARGYPADQWGADVMLHLFPSSRFNPYLLGGWAQLNLDEPEGKILRMAGGEFGVGVKIRILRDEGARWDLRLDARNVLARNDIPLEEAGNFKHHLFFTAGISMTLANPDRDTDGDGVMDRFDRCPKTVLGAKVDPFGCPLDYDEDGVPDGLDRCPATPLGARVDAAGCPSDTDGDGVPDGIDLCNDTLPGVVVDAAGCGLDTDGDGVFDGLDLCPGTPSRITVDEYGCPLTPTVSAAEVELLHTGNLVLAGVAFEPGTATLTPASHPALDEAGAILIKWSELEIEIGGHTDSQGDAAAGRELSRQQAQAVLDYLQSKFLTLGLARFRVRGYGDSQPLAPTTTAEGRARNRRIELRVSNPAVLQRIR